MWSGSDQSEQRKRAVFTEARTLVSAKQFDQAIRVLNELHKDFPRETEIGKLLEMARSDQAEQHKQQKLAEARVLILPLNPFPEAVALLERLVGEYPNDAGIGKLRGLAQHEQEKHARALRIEGELDVLKKMISEKKYPEVLSRIKQLSKDFSRQNRASGVWLSSPAVNRKTLRRIDCFRNAVEEASALFASHRYKEAMNAAESGW